MFMEHSVILWDRLQIVVKIRGPEGEEQVSLEHHIKRKFMVNAHQDSENQETQWAAQVVWRTGNVYSTLVGKRFDMAPPRMCLLC